MKNDPHGIVSSPRRSGGRTLKPTGGVRVHHILRNRTRVGKDSYVSFIANEIDGLLYPAVIPNFTTSSQIESYKKRATGYVAPQNWINYADISHILNEDATAHGWGR